MKVIIPAAGMGTRLRPHTYTTPKTLVHVAGRPILAHIVESVIHVDALSELIFIVGEAGNQIREYVVANYKVPSTYIRQENPRGLGHAVSLAKDRTAGEPVLILLDDGVLEVDAQQMLQSPHTIIGVKEVDAPQNFGIVEIEGEFISRLIEKPEHPPTNLAIAGMYYIRDSHLLFECLDELIERNIRTKNEYQLTDGLQLMLERGERMKAAQINWLDCGKPEALLETNQYLLAKHPQIYDLPDSVVIPPVFIGDGVTVKHSVIGPYASIGDGAQIANAIIRNAVIHPEAQLQNILLNQSIIGASARIVGNFHSLNIGSSSQMDLGK